MHVLAVLIFVLGVYAQTKNGRVGFGFLEVATVLLGLFGLAAYGLSEALPLDAVVDDDGVTFGGATVRWAEVIGFQRQPTGKAGTRAVRIRTREGPITVGPGPHGTVEAFARALGARLDARDEDAPKARGNERGS